MEREMIGEMRREFVLESNHCRHLDRRGKARRVKAGRIDLGEGRAMGLIQL